MPPDERSANSPPPFQQNTNATLRTLYLSSIGAIFLIAHLSYYIQYPGLLSKSGIEPSGRILPRAFPGLHRSLVDGGWVDVDDLCEVACCVGVVLACAVASGLVQHALVFVSLTLIYYFLTVMGGPFYTFQWDILLTETGFLTAACCAPLLRRKIAGANFNEAINGIGTWPVRFLLFKLMFMSGVVKIQADCPTWKNLTALEYHFATQCLPGPLAFYAHQLHPFFLRLSVAATFVIEIPAAFLLIAPTAALRRIGAILQILLQVVIIATGNYTFFNILTIALCIPCMEEDRHDAFQKRERLSGRRIQQTACLIFILWASSKMFLFEYIRDANRNTWHMNVKLTMSKADCDYLIERTVPVAFLATVTFLVASAISCLKNQSRRGQMLVLIQLLTCVFCIGIVSFPLLDLTPKLSSSGFIRSDTMMQLLYRARKYHISNGFGLFRRMTGVGSYNPTSDSSENARGWAGLPPSIVARPEVILEAKFADDNSTYDEWQELNFRWKPGDITLRPRQVAPHQPRLDWRMWFAALGHYQHNPWFVSLIDKLLQGCPLVIDLLDEPDLKAGRKRVTRVRSRLYHYDFTRIASEWSLGIPGAILLQNGEVRSQNTTHFYPVKLSSWWRDIFSIPRQYWTRQFVREYTPPISAENQHPSVAEFLSSAGYTKMCEKLENRCALLKKVGTVHRICSITTSIRQLNLIWAPVAMVAFVWGWCLKNKFRNGRRGNCRVHSKQSEKKKEE